jgi:nicotinate-nucleotide adenylyltransferase
MTQERRVGVLGGTFDPVHIGHLVAAEDVAHALNLERVLFVPNRLPPHKLDRAVSPAEDRAAMVGLAVADNPLFELSLIELERAGPSYTLDTLRSLRGRFGAETALYFLVGKEALPELHTWHEPDALLAEFNIVVMDRSSGQSILWQEVENRFPDIRSSIQMANVAQLDVSGADLRRRVRQARPIRYQVPLAVSDYIRERGLYR